MEIEDVRALVTVASVTVFLAIVAWAYGRGAKRRFGEAEQLPFADEPAVEPAVAKREEGDR